MILHFTLLYIFYVFLYQKTFFLYAAPIVELTILEKRICEVFDIFDTTKSDEIDVKDLGIIIRTLGCVVTEAELQEIQVQVEDVVTNRIPLKKFLEYMSKAIGEYK